MRLRPYSGKDDAVMAFLQQHASVLKMRRDIVNFLNDWIPSFETENRSYLTIAVGCTGGRHRSVFLVDRMAGDISTPRRQIISSHRDL